MRSDVFGGQDGNISNFTEDNKAKRTERENPFREASTSEQIIIIVPRTLIQQDAEVRVAAMRSSSCPRVLLFCSATTPWWISSWFARSSPAVSSVLGGSVVSFFVVLQVVPSGVLGLAQWGEVEAGPSRATNSCSAV